MNSTLSRVPFLCNKSTPVYTVLIVAGLLAGMVAGMVLSV